MSEIPKPWTAIIPLNEEYFLATAEAVNLLKAKKNPLPLCCVRSRKFTSELSSSIKLSGKPWEEYNSGTVITLNYSFDADDPEHSDFTLQSQAKRDFARNLHAVFLDYVELKMRLFETKTPYRIGFKLKQIPKDSETRDEVRKLISLYERDYDLYKHTSNQAKKLYHRIYANPSCLEICSIKSTSPNDYFAPTLVTEKYLNGTSDASHEMMMQLADQTGWIVLPVFKRYDTHAKGFVLDGLVKRIEVTA